MRLSNLEIDARVAYYKSVSSAERSYRNSEQNGWNDYLIGVQTANTTYLGSIKTAENTYKTASDAAERTFDTTTVTAYTSFQETAKTLDTAFYAAVSDANDTNFTTTTYFTSTGANANLSYQKTAFATQETDDAKLAVSTIDKTDEQIRGAARRSFGNVVPTGWQVHHIYPVRLVRKFEELGIDINATENLRAIHPEIHSRISTMQNTWFDNKIEAEINILEQQKYKNFPRNKLVAQAKQNVYTKITLDEIDKFNDVIEETFGDYLVKANPGFFDSEISTVVKRTEEFLKKPESVTELTNKARNKLGLKLLVGTAVIFAFIDSFATASEIYNPSPDTQFKFTTMMNRYADCTNMMQRKKYIAQNQWFLLESATLDYLRAINVDGKIINSLWTSFELEGTKLPN